MKETTLADTDFLRGMQAAAGYIPAVSYEPFSWPGMILLHPMCVAIGETPDAFEWLCQRNFCAFYAMPVQLTKEQIYRIWNREIPHRDPELVKVFEKLMTWEKALLVGVDSESGFVGDTAIRLSALKGPSDPFMGQKDELRSYLGAANLLNNLVHSSDDWPRVAREVFVVLGDEAPGFWSAWSAHRRGEGASGATLVADGSSRALKDELGVSLAHICSALQRNIADRILESCTSLPFGQIDSLVSSVSRVLNEHAEFAAKWTSRQPIEALLAYREQVRPIYPVLASLGSRRLQSGFFETLLSASEALDRLVYRHGDIIDPSVIIQGLAQASIELPTKDLLVLESEYAVACKGKQ